MALYTPHSPIVDLGGIEPPSDQLILGHAKISLVEHFSDQLKCSIIYLYGGLIIGSKARK